MKKSELIAVLAEQSGLKKVEAQKALDALIAIVGDELAKGEKVQIAGFGTFEVSERPAREGRNPRNGETLTIEASKAPRFKAGKALKDRVNA